ALGRPEHGGIVAQGKRRGVAGERGEIAGDHLLRAEVSPLVGSAALNPRASLSVANSFGRAFRAIPSRMPLTTLGSSSAKKACAMSTNSEMVTRAGTSLRCKIS